MAQYPSFISSPFAAPLAASNHQGGIKQHSANSVHNCHRAQQPPASNIVCAANKQPWSFAARARNAWKESASTANIASNRGVVNVGGKHPPPKNNDPVSKVNIKYVALKPVAAPKTSLYEEKQQSMLYAPKAYESLANMLRRERFLARRGERADDFARVLEEAKNVMKKKNGEDNTVRMCMCCFMSYECALLLQNVVLFR